MAHHLEPPRVELTDVGLFGAMDRYGDIAIHAVIDLTRTFDRAALERALAATIADFPVLGHRYEPGTWRDRWVRVEGPISEAVHVEEPEDLEARTADWVRAPVDATRERQVRLVALMKGDRMRVILTIMHLAVDGAGIAAVGHVLGAHLYRVPPELPVDRRRDIWRALEGLRWFHVPVIAKEMLAQARRPLEHLLAAPRDRPYPTDGAAPATWRDVVIDEAHLRALRRACGGATVNDVLLAGIARVAAQRSTGGPVVITYTMDLRRYGKAPRLMAANSSSILAAVVPRHAVGDLPTAARAVARTTAAHRASLAGPGFLLGPYALGAGAPHGLARGLVRLLSPALVDLPLDRGLLVTNVGRVDEGLRAFGDDLASLRIIGPNVRGFPVPVIVAFGFRGALRLHLFAGPGLGDRVLDEMEAELRAAFALE